jgi:hypothetical protein
MKISIPVFVSIFLLHWMHLNVLKPKWIDSLYDKFPVVYFKLNTEIIGLNTGAEFVEAVKLASDYWSFLNVESRFQYSYKGTTTAKPIGVEQIKCSEIEKEKIRELPSLVFANKEESDCSSEVCSYIWSCLGDREILHFDLEINSKENEFATNDLVPKKTYHLTTIVAKEFGKILGLSYCSSSLTLEECNTEINLRGESNPSSDSLLYKFNEKEQIKYTPSDDDKKGIQTIYGKISSEEIKTKQDINEFYSLVESICNPSPCKLPEEDISVYHLSHDEIKARVEHELEMKKEGLGDYATEIHYLTQGLKELYFKARAEANETPESYLLPVIRERKEDIQSLSLEMKNKSRAVLSIQIKNRDFILKNFYKEFDNEFLKFLKAELKVLIQYRRDIIDRM